MAEILNSLTGLVAWPKSALDRDVFAQEPANRASAFADLWRWANDRERTITVAGRPVHLKRGQLGYSQLTLARLWRWDKEKVRRVLSEFQNEGLITFDGTNSTTVITVVDYTVYNADSADDALAESPTEPLPVPLAETPSVPLGEPLQKGEVGRGNREGGGGAREGLNEIPNDAEVLEFAAGFAGEPSSGAPGPIAEGFAVAWLARMLGRQQFPPRWQRALVADWRAGFRSFAAGGQVGNGVAKKIGEKNGAAVSASVRRIELEKRLREAREAWEAADQAGDEAGAAPWARRVRELEAEMKTV